MKPGPDRDLGEPGHGHAAFWLPAPEAAPRLVRPEPAASPGPVAAAGDAGLEGPAEARPQPTATPSSRRFTLPLPPPPAHADGARETQAPAQRAARQPSFLGANRGGHV